MGVMVYPALTKSPEGGRVFTLSETPTITELISPGFTAGLFLCPLPAWQGGPADAV
jgi:hypothetical protein